MKGQLNLNRFDEAMDADCEAIDLITNRCEQSVRFFKSELYMGYEAIERACGDAINLRDEYLSYMYYDVHDSDAIRVEFKGETVGYVGNSSQTVPEGITSASDIQNRFSDKATARILFRYLDYYLIAKLIP